MLYLEYPSPVSQATGEHGLLILLHNSKTQKTWKIIEKLAVVHNENGRLYLIGLSCFWY